MVRRSAGLNDAMAVVETAPEKDHEREIKHHRRNGLGKCRAMSPD
jgi:hypothetical protein